MLGQGVGAGREFEVELKNSVIRWPGRVVREGQESGQGQGEEGVGRVKKDRCLYVHTHICLCF